MCVNIWRKRLVMLRKRYCLDSPVILIDIDLFVVKIQGSNEELTTNKLNGRWNVGVRQKSFYLVKIKSIHKSKTCLKSESMWRGNKDLKKKTESYNQFIPTNTKANSMWCNVHFISITFIALQEQHFLYLWTRKAVSEHSFEEEHLVCL